MVANTQRKYSASNVVSITPELFTLEQAVRALFTSLSVPNHNPSEAQEHVHRIKVVADDAVLVELSSAVGNEADAEAVIARIQDYCSERLNELTGSDINITIALTERLEDELSRVEAMVYVRMTSALSFMKEQGGVVSSMIEHMLLEPAKDKGINIVVPQSERQLFEHAGELFMESLERHCPGFVFTIVYKD